MNKPIFLINNFITTFKKFTHKSMLKIFQFSSFIQFFVTISADQKALITSILADANSQFHPQRQLADLLVKKLLSKNRLSFCKSRYKTKPIISEFLKEQPYCFCRTAIVRKPNQISMLVSDGTSYAINLQKLMDILEQYYCPNLTIKLFDWDQHSSGQEVLCIYTIFENDRWDFDFIYLLVEKHLGCYLSSCCHHWGRQTSNKNDPIIPTWNGIPITEDNLGRIKNIRINLNNIYIV